MRDRVVLICAWAGFILVMLPLFLMSFALLSEQDKDELADAIEECLS